jgi:CHAT domain-containing protein
MKVTERVTILWTAFVSLFLLISGCAVSRFEGSTARRSALLRGEVKEAFASYEAEAQQAEKDAAWEAAVRAYLAAASAAKFAGQLQKAITYGEKALEIAHKTKVSVFADAWGSGPSNLQPPPLPELRAINHLIRAYQSIRDFDKARALVDRGSTLLRENPAGDPITRLGSEAALYAALADDLLRRREYDEAIDALLRAVYLRRMHYVARSDRSHRRKLLRNLAENSEISLTGSLLDLAHAYRLIGRFDDALQLYREASKHVSAGGTRATHEQAVYLGLGKVYLQQKQFPLALENFQKALSLAEKQQRSAGISSASLGVGATLREIGSASEAIPYYQKAIQQTESTRSLLQSEEYRKSFFEGSLKAYFAIIESLSESGKAEDAFNYSERARSRAFLDLLGSKTQLSRLQGGLREEEKALQERVAGTKVLLSGQVGEGDGEGEDIDGASLRKQLAEAETAYSNFLARVRKENKEQASLMDVEPLTLKQTQELLDPGVAMLEYFVTKESVMLWVVDKEKVSSIPLRRERLQSQVTAYREAITELAEKEKFNALSQGLYKLLIQPALPHIRGKELLIIPHGVLHYLPFQALLSPDGQYLIEKYPINYLSSASLMQFTQEKRKAKGDLTKVLAEGGKVLTFGNPDLNDPKKNLQYAGIEAKEIKSLYPQSSVYLGKEATEEKAKALSSENDIIHFASHAELSEDDPLASAILLAKSDKEDGRLEVREIFGMDLKASLVVLSACETGLGKLSSGDELVGLTRAFIYAGTPSVVASLWNVEDSSTAQLMASFYTNLKTMTKVEALRQAQLQLIRGNVNSELLARRGIGGVGKLGEVSNSALQTPSSELADPSSISVSTSHPYFWAPFILVGEGK